MTDIMSAKEIKDRMQDIDWRFDNFVPMNEQDRRLHVELETEYKALDTALAFARIARAAQKRQGMNCEHDDNEHSNAEEQMICMKCDDELNKLLAALPEGAMEGIDN